MTLLEGPITMPFDQPVFTLTCDIPPAPGRGRVSPYPFAEMAIGHSFFAPGRTRLNICYWQRKTGYRYLQALRVENGIKGVRCWRIA
jgi:hypothetical protein